MENFLIAIIPSEDITLKIRPLRTKIFRRFGLISSRCLPEMIPVTYTMGFIGKEQFSDIVLSNTLTSSFTFSIEGRDIFLLINKTDIIKEVNKRVYNPKAPGIISIKEGFYLCTTERETNTREVLAYLNSETKKILHWRKNELKLLRIETNCDNWWENIWWETIWKQKLRLTKN